MFYSVDFSRSGKSPVARMWQACHGLKIPKKVLDDFDIAAGVKAIESPEDERRYALRLTGSLLLGVTKIHNHKVLPLRHHRLLTSLTLHVFSAQVDFFASTIKSGTCHVRAESCKTAALCLAESTPPAPCLLLRAPKDARAQQRMCPVMKSSTAQCARHHCPHRIAACGANAGRKAV